MDKIYKKVVDTLQHVPGLVAIVLGGSQATGTATADSDIDIGLYYETEMFDLKILSQQAMFLDDAHRTNLMTAIGEWGRGVNGGGWLTVNGTKLDLLYRDMARVKEAVKKAKSGNIEFYYQTGHPHTFLNLIYVGEVKNCRMLWQKDNCLQQLKDELQVYPAMLKTAALQYFGFEMNFSLMFVKEQVDKQDLHYLSGHVFRSVSCLLQYLFALNERYCLNEKKAVRNANCFERKPENLEEKVTQIYALLAESADRTAAAVLLEQLIREAEQC